MKTIKTGQLVKAHRIAAGLSQAALAARCGIHRNTITAIEAGRPTTVSTLIAIAKSLKTRPNRLICG